MTHRRCILLVVLACGCSILDPGDRDELTSQISTLPPAEMSLMKKMVMNVKAMRWLEYKDDNDQMGKLQCRYQAGGQWSQWTDQEPTYTVADMLECLINRPFAVTYVMCKDEWKSLEHQLRKTDLKNSRPVPGGASIDCRFVWAGRWAGLGMPPQAHRPHRRRTHRPHRRSTGRLLMNLSMGETKSLVPRVVREAAIGHGLFSTKDPAEWKSNFEDLGRLCAEVWHDDLPEGDRAWTSARRERFRKWVDDARPNGIHPTASPSALQSGHDPVPAEFTPPWPMLLAAVESAFIAFVEAFEEAPAGESERAVAELSSRLQRTYLWRTLSADETAEQHRSAALRVFQRGFQLGRRGTPKSMRRPIPPMLEPPWYWGAGLPEYPGPSAARERALRAERERALRAPPVPDDRDEWLTRQQELRDLYASAWREDVPEEDREWAQAYRDCCTGHVNRRRHDAIARSAYESYLQSSGGVFDGAPGRPWANLSRHASEPWRAFADRVEDAPDGESEIETAEAAAREYWDTLYREAPPWDGDPDQAHWLAAVRAARAKALADYVLPARGR